MNTFYFRNGDGTVEPPFSKSQNAYDRVHAAFTDGHDLYPTAWKLVLDTTVDWIEAETGTILGSHTVVPLAEISGTGGAGFNALATGVLLRQNTAGIVNGRKVKGRAFLSPIGPREEADGSVTTSGRAVAQSIGDALLDPGLTGVDLVVWSRPAPGRAGSEHLVTSTIVPDTFVVLRSRRD